MRPPHTGAGDDGLSCNISLTTKLRLSVILCSYPHPAGSLSLPPGLTVVYVERHAAPPSLSADLHHHLQAEHGEDDRDVNQLQHLLTLLGLRAAALLGVLGVAHRLHHLITLLLLALYHQGLHHSHRLLLAVLQRLPDDRPGHIDKTISEYLISLSLARGNLRDFGIKGGDIGSIPRNWWIYWWDRSGGRGRSGRGGRGGRGGG